MKLIRSFVLPSLLAVIMHRLCTPTVSADTFGSGVNAFTIEFVTVGNAGNGVDPAGGLSGNVPYEYRIGKYEIPQHVIDKATNMGMTNVVAGPWSGDQPATGVSWYEAAAFVNWLNTSTGCQPAYNLTWTGTAWTMNLWNSADAWQQGGENLYRHKDAVYFLPNDREWYKAAYHKNDGVTDNYWIHPTQSDTPPNGIDFAGDPDYEAVLLSPFHFAPYSVTNAGNKPSPYGTFGQAGNVIEWMESASDLGNNTADESRRTRGGNYNNSVGTASDFVTGLPPTFQVNGVGFRIASLAGAPQIVVDGIAPGPTIYFQGVETNSTKTMTAQIRNLGSLVLAVTNASFAGADPSHFSVLTPLPLFVPPGGNIGLDVRFSPTADGERTAAVQLTSNDADDSPFLIYLSGYGLGTTLDYDGDGLNDLAEHKMAALGFDFVIAQPELVATYYQSANSAGLYTSNQVQALNLDVPVLQRNPATGLFTLGISVGKSTTLGPGSFSPFPLNQPGTSTNITPEGKLEFTFPATGDAAFFRIESD